jgi:hypothetical protein
LAIEQRAGAGQLGAGEREIGQGTSLVGARAGDLGLEWARIDLGEKLALADKLAVAEVDGLQIAGHARAHLDLVARDEIAGIFVPVDDLPLERVGDGNRRRALRRALRLGGAFRLVAASKQEGEQQEQPGQKMFGRHEPSSGARARSLGRRYSRRRYPARLPDSGPAYNSFKGLLFPEERREKVAPG